MSIARKGCAEVVGVPEPVDRPGEVSVALSHVGLCGPDLHLFDGAVGTVTAVGGPDGAGGLTDG